MAEPSWFKFYAKLPIWMQNCICSAAGIRMRRARYNSYFKDAFNFLRGSERWSLDQLRAYQDKALCQLIDHAYQTVPYYRQLLDSLGAKPGDIRSADDMARFPVLEKQTVREHAGEMVCTAWPKKRMVHEHTGGTTGTSLQLETDVETQPWQWAMVWRHRARFGVTLHEPFVVFAGRSVVPLSNMDPPIWRRNWPMHQTYVSVHHMTRQNMEPLARYLQNRRGVAFYNGYPSALYLLATYLLENNIKLNHPPRMVFTGAETLLPHQRRAISQAMGCDVGDHYGATEMVGFISECERHRYHVEMEFGIVELLPLPDGPANVRRIVCTGLHNPVMPLIRYNSGDLATVSDRPCDCGRASPVVERIDGRIESYVMTPDGRQLGRLDFLFKDTAGVREAQLIQDTPDHLTVRLVRGEGYSPAQEASLLKDMRGYLGEQIRIDIEYVPEIPREPNGKFRQIISKVFRDRYAAAGPG